LAQAIWAQGHGAGAQHSVTSIAVKPTEKVTCIKWLC